MIEFNQLYYLITIVDNDFNLTRSAKLLHLTQPALSKSIAELEYRQDVKIFNRKKGRIVGLTTVGNKLIHDANKVYKNYTIMMAHLQNISSSDHGTVRIGIAPVIISTVFSDAITLFMQEKPGIKLELVEKGAYKLQEMLVFGKLDLAVLVSPVTFNSIEESVIYRNSVAVWFNRHHRFHKMAGAIPLSEIAKEKIITLSDNFMVTYQFKNLLCKNHLDPDIFFQTESWDLILNMCQDTDSIGIIAAPIENNYDVKEIEHRDIIPYFPWNISICNVFNAQPNATVDHAKEWFKNYFS